MKPIKKYIAAFLIKRSRDIMQQQQIITYIVATCLTIVGLTLHLFHYIGASATALRLLSLVSMVVCLTAFILWFTKRWKVRTAFACAALVVQFAQILKIIYISHAMPQAYHYLIVLNGVISMTLMVLLAMNYLRLTSVIVGGSNLLVLLYAGEVIPNKVLWQFITLIGLLTVFFVFMGDTMYRNVKHIQQENTTYNTNERNLLQTLRLNRKEITAYLDLCHNQTRSDKETDRLFSILSERSQRNMIKAVEQKKAIDASESERTKAAFPDFTPTELEVARLILRDMKLSQIANLTGKSATNITVVRTRLRRKLGLAPGDDLHNALAKQMKRKRAGK